MVILRQISQFIFEDVAGGNEPIFQLVSDNGTLNYLHQSGYGCLTADKVIVVTA
jgi:hypothetical protein